MEFTDDGSWTWKPFWDRHDALIDKCNQLVRLWNRHLPLIRRQNVGRPLAASEAQCEQVRKLRKARWSLRAIAEETEPQHRPHDRRQGRRKRPRDEEPPAAH